MDIIEIFKQYAQRYSQLFPREHLYTAIGLAVALVVLLLIPSSDKGAAVPNQSISIPVELSAVEEELEEA